MRSPSRHPIIAEVNSPAVSHRTRPLALTLRLGVLTVALSLAACSTSGGEGGNEKAQDKAPSTTEVVGKATTTTGPKDDVAETSTTVDPADPSQAIDAESDYTVGQALLETALEAPDPGNLMQAVNWSFGPKGLTATLREDQDLMVPAMGIDASGSVAVTTQIDTESSDAADATVGVVCRSGPDRGGYIGLVSPTEPGSDRYVWAIFRENGVGDVESIATSNADTIVTNQDSLLTVGLLCDTRPEGEALTLVVGGDYLATVVDPDPISGSWAGLHLSSAAAGGSLVIRWLGIHGLVRS